MGKPADVTLSPVVGDERHSPAGPKHRLGQRLRREHVPSGAARGNDEKRLAHARLPGAGPEPSERPPTRGPEVPPGIVQCPLRDSMSPISPCGLKRVSASSIPSANPLAMREDPP